jgi:4-carboxymuconolactone decarboxylase
LGEYRRTLLKLTVRDRCFFDQALASEEGNRAASGLDAKAHAFVQIGAMIASDAAPQSYAICVDAARQAGASVDEIVGTLVAAMPVLGTPKVVAAASKFGVALGYDIDFALEHDAGLED